MKLKLITLGGVKLSRDVYEVILPTPEGPIAVFPDHEPLVTLATNGVVSVRKAKEDRDEQLSHYAISGGVIEISGNMVKVLVDEADQDDEIVVSEVEDALKRAQELRANAKDQIELEKAHRLVDRHTVRLKVADLHRRKRR